MKTLQIGIVGAGRIGNVHAQSITYHIPNAAVRMITDINEAAAKTVAERYSIPSYGADYRAILNDPEIDAVLVCSPTPTHADIAIAAMRAGKHVFCEKPVDLTLEKIRATAECAKETGRKLQIGFNRRFDHNHGRVQALAKGGALGNIELIKITSRDPEPPSPEYAASSGGLFIDMMIHDFDMAMFLAGCDVREVYATGTSLVDKRIGEAGDVDTAIVTLTFENGALGVIDNSRQAVYGYDQRVEVFGSKGCITADNETANNTTLYTESGVLREKPLHFFLERYNDAYIQEEADFVDACLNGTPTPVTAFDGLQPVLIAIAAKKSCELGGVPVKVGE